jgi:methylmalonyl-CoA mutase
MMKQQEKIQKSNSFSYANDFPEHRFDDWRDLAEKGLKGAPYDKVLLTQTAEGITLKPIYTQDDVKDIPFLHNLPGFTPFVRNTSISGNTKQVWAIAQECDIPDMELWNKALLEDLNKGQNTVYIKFDDNASIAKPLNDIKANELGINGSPVYSLNDLKKALQGISLEDVNINIEAYSAALATAAMIESIADKNNVDLKKVKGSISTDPIAILANNGSLPNTWKQAMDEMAELTRWAIDNAPQIKTIMIDATVWNNAGASAVQELSYALSTAVIYISEMLERGFTIEQVSKNITFSFGIGKHLFMETSKLRAARYLWAQIIESFKGSEDSQKMYIFAKTSQYNKTYYDPWVNILRTSTEAFSAILGSCDALCINTFDSIVKRSDEFSRRIARNQHNVLLEEAHLDRVIDPAGGSWYVESLTNEICEKSWALFQEIDSKEFIRLLQDETIQNEIENSHKFKLKNITNRKEALIGTSVFANLEEKKLETNDYDMQAIYNKIENGLVADSVEIAFDKNIVANMRKELEKGVSVASIYKALWKDRIKDIEIKKVSKRRLAEQYETLRNASIEYQNKNGHLPQVFLAAMSPINVLKPRMDFSQGFFQPGGFAVNVSDYYDSIDKACKDAVASKSPVIVICATDDAYPELVPSMTQKLKKENSSLIVIVAGYPTDHIDKFKESGVDFFIHLKADTVQTLSDIMKKIGVL